MWRQPLKNLKWYGLPYITSNFLKVVFHKSYWSILEYLVSYGYCITQCIQIWFKCNLLWPVLRHRLQNQVFFRFLKCYKVLTFFFFMYNKKNVNYVYCELAWICICIRYIACWLCFSRYLKEHPTLVEWIDHDFSLVVRLVYIQLFSSEILLLSNKFLLNSQ